MKKLTIKTVLAGVLITSSMMLSCNDVTTSFPDVDYVPFKFSENDDWGLISVDGEPLFEDMFKEMPSISVNGVFATTNDKGEVIYYISDKNPKQIGSDSYIYGGCYSEGVIPVVKQEQPISFINKEGKEVLSLSAVEGKRITAVNAYFSDGLMTFCTEDNKYGYINAQGNVVVKPIYDDAFPFNEGVALVKKNDKYLIINTSGKETVELKQDLKEYIERQKLITNVDIIDNTIAIAKGSPYMIYRREDIAKIADTLLFFNDIEASFVIAKTTSKTISVSGRSLGNYDISKMLTPLGGGGNKTVGAARISDSTISKVETKLKQILKKEEE